MTEEARAALEASLGYRFVRPEHLAVALTHRSTGDGTHNETLEFLGDAVLSLAVSDLLMRRFPTATEGDLSKRRASLVNAEELAQKARAMDLGRWLSVGKGEERSGGRAKEKILAAAYEAVLGAVYLDAGWEPARQVVEAHFAPGLAREPQAPGHRDYKTRLQELTASRTLGRPRYLVRDEGPDHAKHFFATVLVGDQPYGEGEGRSKKQAEQAAAWVACSRLREEGGDDAGVT